MSSALPRPDAPGSSWPALPLATAAGALLLYAALLPMGASRVESARFATNAILLGGPLDPAVTAPLSLLVAGVSTVVPIGDLATRAHLASTVPAALAIALLVSYLLRVARALRPASNLRTLPGDLVHESIACVGAAVVVAASPAFALGGSQAGGLALTASLVMGGFLLAARALAAPSDALAGLGLALLCGVAAGVDPIAIAVLWPPALLLWIASLRAGERWTLLAPFVFALGLGVLLVLVAVSTEPPADLALIWDRLTLRALRMGLAGASGPQAWTMLTRIVGDLGVVASLVGVVGVVGLVLRTPVHAGLIIYGGWAIVLVGSGIPAGQPRADLATGLLEFLCGAVVAAGAVVLAQQLERGRAAACLALMVISAVNPVIALSQEQDSIILRQDQP